MSTAAELAVARMLADLGVQRLEIVSTAESDNRGRQVHRDDTALDREYGKLKQQREKLIKETIKVNSNNPVAAWNAMIANADTNTPESMLEIKWDGQAHRLNASRSLRYNNEPEARQSEERIQYLAQRAAVVKQREAKGFQRVPSPGKSGVTRYVKGKLVTTTVKAGTTAGNASAMDSRIKDKLAAANLLNGKATASIQVGPQQPARTTPTGPAALHGSRNNLIAKKSKDDTGSTSSSRRKKMVTSTQPRPESRREQPHEDVEITNSWQAFAKAESTPGKRVRPPTFLQSEAAIIKHITSDAASKQPRATTSGRLLPVIEPEPKPPSPQAVHKITALPRGTQSQSMPAVATEMSHLVKQAIRSEELPSTGTYTTARVAPCGKPSNAIDSSAGTFPVNVVTAKNKSIRRELVLQDLFDLDGITDAQYVKEILEQLFDLNRKAWLLAHPQLVEQFVTIGNLIRKEMAVVARLSAEDPRYKGFLDHFGIIPDVLDHIAAARRAFDVVQDKARDETFFIANDHYQPFLGMARKLSKAERLTESPPSSAEPSVKSSVSDAEYVPVPVAAPRTTATASMRLEPRLIELIEKNVRAMFARSPTMFMAPGVTKRNGIFYRVD